MFYECDELNCALARLGITCSNRNFEKGIASYENFKLSQKRYAVCWTGNRGHGLRATQDIEPHRFIIEYKGELIGQEECQQRMANMYQDTQAIL
ncbi:Histone-lysine N-methyltransferase, H3 lysine-36 specific [Neolecta irregularis DAH-3]|uniref:Histone-lysine N-methyltransferase, H3 lysine-36 specific n=1 Tax=Neolecta irregularis (strain DAH-3) TaxID=1198029 RepID=A0A1U7LJ48_NEOID|nr:Histone-lysine N-methyltransferase, H3 lysine-36 specific [Neolecta irregularis DAH-3]|eukprot:OLL22669.1 Histone-lysine N-methyltransferase, H3 lysine-36 specific [Neolecta irregularis DAH-3]